MARTRTAFIVVVAAAAATPFLTASAASPPAATPANPDPAQFQDPQQNPYYPLTPGLVTRLRGTDGDEHFRETVRITARTRMIAGVRTVVVRDVVWRGDGSLAEATDDWYAADDDGNVWYFGEDTATYDEDGNVESREGSWEAGGDGAVAGIIMPAHPRPSEAARMEFSKGEAEDQAWVVQRLPYVRTPGGRRVHVVRTLEWSRLEPEVVSMKFYARGLGIVEERDIAAGSEHFWVVSATRP
jgi:hypothetical protein